MSDFLRILSRQLAADLRALPGAPRRLLGVEARVGRCVSIADLRKLARRKVPRVVFDYVDGGACDEVTLRRNVEDFAALAIEPRVLVDVASVDTSTTVLGCPVAVPIIGAPTGMTGLMHHRGELAIARALHAAGSIYTLGTPASYSIEEVAAETAGPLWFQVYVWRDRGLVRELVERAAAAGYLALVVTVDTQRSGARERDIRNRFATPPRITLRSCLEALTRPRWAAAFVTRPKIAMANIADRIGPVNAVSLSRFINDQIDPSLSYADLEWLRGLWAGPLAVKGILRPDDARAVVDLGADAVVVSNHGGRQLDHAVSTVRVLPAVVDAVGSDAEVLVDGGIRRGTDVLKAIALGARACLAGRALVYGLGAGGDAGARRAVQILSEELRLALALSGCPSLDAVDRTLVREARPSAAGIGSE